MTASGITTAGTIFFVLFLFAGTVVLLGEATMGLGLVVVLRDEVLLGEILLGGVLLGEEEDVAIDSEEVYMSDVAEPGVVPMVNRLIASCPVKQLLLRRSLGSVAAMLQHMGPPAAAHVSEHCHMATPWVEKLIALAPWYSSEQRSQYQSSTSTKKPLVAPLRTRRTICTILGAIRGLP